MDSRIEQYIHEYALNDHLNPDLLRSLKLFQLPAHYQLYQQMDEQTYLYFLVSGRVQVNHYHFNGKLSVLGLLTPLAVIGDLELFSFDDIQTNVITLDQTTLLGVEKVFIMRHGYDDPRFLRFLIHNLTAKLYQTSFIQTGHVLPLTNRLALYLLHESALTDSPIQLLPKTHLAGLLGTTVRHLNRVMKQLQEEGIIELERYRLTILNRSELEAYAQS